MTLISNGLAIIIGLSGGAVVGSGVFGFITMIDVFPRLADRTNTAEYIKWYEWCIIAGGIVGNIITVFNTKIYGGMVSITLFGMFSGLFVGCLAMAIAEVLNVIPIFIQRSKLTQGLALVVLALALGKGLGSVYQLLFMS